MTTAIISLQEEIITFYTRIKLGQRKDLINIQSQSTNRNYQRVFARYLYYFDIFKNVSEKRYSINSEEKKRGSSFKGMSLDRSDNIRP